MNYNKTVLDWLNELPDGYRELALEVRHKNNEKDLVSTIYVAIDRFSWEKTPQGDKFWGRVWDILAENEPLPPIADLAHLRLDIPQAETPAPAPPPAAQSAWRTLGESEPAFGEIVLIEEDDYFSVEKYKHKTTITENGDGYDTVSVSYTFEDYDGDDVSYEQEQRWCPIPKK